MKKTLPEKLERYRKPHPLFKLVAPKGNINGYFEIPYQGHTLSVIASCDAGWDHVSVSRRKHIPTWQQMAYIKNLFFEPEETAFQLHPPQSQYVNMCKTCLHIWRPWNDTIPLPPIYML